MGATSKKRSLRGGKSPASAEIVELTEPESFSKPEELDEPEDLEDGILDSPLPKGCVEDKKTGAWTYTLIHPLSDGTRVPSKVVIPKEIYGKDIRNSSRGKTEQEALFYMLASCSGVPPRTLDMLHAIDYTVLATLMNRRALKNSQAVLASLAGQDRSTS